MADDTLSSGNVFKDLGLPSPDESLAKAKLAYKINRLIADQRMSRSKMTGLRNGRLKGFTIDRLCFSVGKTRLSYRNPSKAEIKPQNAGNYQCCFNLTQVATLVRTGIT